MASLLIDFLQWRLFDSQFSMVYFNEKFSLARQMRHTTQQKYNPAFAIDK